MKRQEFFTYLNSINELTDLKGVKFSFAVIKNKKLIESEIETLKSVVLPSDEFNEFENKRIELCVEHSEKDDNNEPIIEENQYKIKDNVLFNEELSSLKEENQSIIDERVKQIKDYEELLKEEIEFDFNMINFDDVPLDITPSQLEKIEFMVNI